MATPVLADGEKSNPKAKFNIVSQYLGRQSMNALVLASQSDDFCR